MAIDANIFSQFAQPVRSVTDIQNDLNRNDLAQSQIAQSQMGVRNALAVEAQKNQLRQAVQSGQLDLSNPDHAQRALAIAPDVAPALLKTVQEGQTSRALMGKDNAQAAHFTSQTAGQDLTNKAAAASQLAARVQTLKNPDDIVNFYAQGVKDGLISREQAQTEIEKVPYNDPAKFEAWKQAQFQASVPVVEKFKQDAESARAQATNTTHLKGIGIQQAGENSRAALSRQTQLTINGMDANGNFVGLGGTPQPAAPQGPPTAAGVPPAAVGAQPQQQGGGLGALVDAIGNNQIPLSTALARVPPGLKAQVMAGVAQKYPNYDETALATRQKANKDFTTGAQGNALRSFAVAGQHLDQLGTLVDALDNGNTQIINKIGNTYAEQTGNPAPTNFDAAKDVVSKEVIKAIVAGGGGVSEREELSKLMDKAKSPAQLKGVITQYRNLMAAQHEALLSQRRAAGLSDSSLPDYSGNAPATHPPEIQGLLNKYGPK